MTEKKNLLEKLQERWQVKSIGQVLVILLVFACTGFSAMYLKPPVFAALGIGEQTPWWIRTLVWLVTIFPAYNVLLLIYGFIFGQFTFFWNFEKRFFGRILRRKL